MRLSLCLFALLAACGGGGKEPCADENKISVYPDSDGDGFGNSNLSDSKCSAPAGFVEIGGDCADDDPATYPGARELCDNLDNNCNLNVDETLSLDVYYADSDGDGRGDPNSFTSSCLPPSGFTDNTDDCDDTDDTRYYGAAEICDGVDNDCDGDTDDDDDDLDPISAISYYRDTDGDGYGNPNTLQLACATLGNNWVLNADDCSDNDAEVYPLATEVCNGIDDNCDALVDDADPALDLATRQTSYADTDGDGYGDPLVTNDSCALVAGFVANDDDCDDTNPLIENATFWLLDADSDTYGDGFPVQDCSSPGPLYIGATFPPYDCDDSDPLIHPNAPEICNLGVDDDCDGAADDADAQLDLATATEWFFDLDGDGYGDLASSVFRCIQPSNATLDDTDCDDSEFAINLLASEICDGLDNDCNGDTDDDDLAVDPAGFSYWYQDSDGDGFGDPALWISSCDPPSTHVGNRDDCDDADPFLGSPADWYPDLDGDGYGDDSGPPLGLGPSCVQPVAGSVPDTLGIDCDDGEVLVNPGEVEVCEDGLDNDCVDGDAICQLPRTCQEHLDADPFAPSGVYEIEPALGFLYDIWCDMDTDGGGWSLVASTRTTPLDDAGSLYYDDITTLIPVQSHVGIWGGLRVVIDDRSDIRFTCKTGVFDASMNVDLSFYDTGWYREISQGSDAASCFSENNGAGYEQPAPARRNNLNLDFRPLGDDWNQGYLEGEDSCGDSFDFTVDFDDRGKDANQSDGTDWGEDDGTRKCGVNNSGGAWFIFVREVP